MFTWALPHWYLVVSTDESETLGARRSGRVCLGRPLAGMCEARRAMGGSKLCSLSACAARLASVLSSSLLVVLLSR